MLMNVPHARTLVACLAGAVALAGASALVAKSTGELAVVGAASAARATLDPCQGGRALCGDRADDLGPELSTPGTRNAELAGCIGGRRACGDRAAQTVQVSMSRDPIVVGHPRTRAR